MKSARDAQLELQRLNAFVDGELELGRQLELEAQLRDDAALRAEADALQRLREAVRGAAYHTAPAGLRARLEAMPQPGRSAPRRVLWRWFPWRSLDVPRPHAPGDAARPAALQRWFAWRPIVAALGVVALLAWGLALTLLPQQRDERLMQEAIAGQVRATLGQHLVDVASSDQHTVKPWLSARLDFSPPVHELPLPGVSLLGGRVDYLDGRPVAALVYRDGRHLVNAFVWPSVERESGIHSATERGFHVAHWTAGGMAHWVVSDMSPEAFAAFTQALQRADAAR